MPEEQEIDTALNLEPHWSEALVGDNAERAEAMKAFGTPDDFFKANDQAADWRRGVAVDDDKYYADLQRFNTAQDYGNSFREAQQTIRAGKLSTPLKDDATEDDIKAYRENNNIPLEAAGYMENLPEGVVIGEDDKEIFGDFMGVLHAKNVAPDVAHDVIGWYNTFAEKQQSDEVERDSVQSTEANDQLRTDWGPDYRANMNLVEGLLNGAFGKEAQEQLRSGRYTDGRAFMNDPDVLKGLADIARKVNPVMEMGGGDHHTAQESMNDEIATLEKFMREKRTEYNKDKGAQDRLRDLYQLRIDHKKVA